MAWPYSTNCHAILPDIFEKLRFVVLKAGRRRSQRPPKNLPKKPRRGDEPMLPDANMVDGATVRLPSYSWTERNRGGAEDANRPRPPPLARSRARTLASVTKGLCPCQRDSTSSRILSGAKSASPPTEIQSAAAGLVSSTLPSRP